MKRIRFILRFLIVTALLIGQDRETQFNSSDEIMRAVDSAIDKELYEQALTLIDRGKDGYPDESRFSARAGELYMDQKLYHLALEEFMEAERIQSSPHVRFQLSKVHGFLDNNEDSARFLEGLLDDPQYGSEAVADLGWMYFKLHRLREGEALMLGALEDGFDRTYAHTLGTIYSGLYNYGKSRDYYLQSIDNALAGSDFYFAAVAYYNLALLEMSFYRYDEALEYTTLSLEQVDRPSGHVAKGELLQLSLDFDKAREEFLTAHALNSESPLALLDLADLYRSFGYLDEALFQIREIKGRQDNSWMYYYGINRQEWDRDITEVSMEVYEGLAREASVRPRWGIKGRIESLWRRIKYGWLFRYHRSRYRKICRDLGINQLAEGNPLHGWTYLAEGAAGYGRTALHYWSLCSDFETSLAPHAEYWYDLRIGRETQRPDLLSDGFDSLYVPWENAPREEALGERLLILKKGGIRRRERESYLRLVGELYGMNWGGLRQRGIALPLRIDVKGAENRKLTRMLYRLHPGGDEENSSLCYHLTLVIREGGDSSWYLQGPDGVTLKEGHRATPQLDREGRRQLVEYLEESLYGAGK